MAAHARNTASIAVKWMDSRSGFGKDSLDVRNSVFDTGGGDASKHGWQVVDPGLGVGHTKRRGAIVALDQPGAR